MWQSQDYRYLKNYHRSFDTLKTKEIVKMEEIVIY